MVKFMKEKDKINFLKLLKKHINYKDGFWIFSDQGIDTLTDEEGVREFIRVQGIPILEKDITDLLSELSFHKTDMDIDEYFYHKVAKWALPGKSMYFDSLDKLYPGNKFRELVNYYLFNDDCYSFILIGYGQTGKSTLVNIISRIIGEAYFGRSNVALLRNSHGTAVLEGKRFFEVAEAQDLDLDTANLLKSIITNDDIFINPKFQLPRKIKPHAKLIMTCNNMPRFRVTDDGIIRRFITIKMDNKIPQNRHFLDDIDSDIPYIIYEALQHPFNIEDFAEEQYYIFENDPQWGFGYGIPNMAYYGENEYEKYHSMCKALGFMPRNKTNFDKFIELAKIYGGKLKCDTTSKDSPGNNGLTLLTDLNEEDLPF